MKKLFLDEQNDVFFSMACIWELAIKINLGKLEIPGHLLDFVTEHILGNNIAILPIELSHLYHLETLPFYHRDPFDRIMIAQSIIEKLPIISSDKTLDSYPIDYKNLELRYIGSHCSVLTSTNTIQSKNQILLNTAFPSRKFHKKYGV